MTNGMTISQLWKQGKSSTTTGSYNDVIAVNGLERERGGQVELRDLPTLVEVEASLRCIEPHKAPGPDHISNAVFKYGAPVLAQAVHGVFTKSLVWEMEPLQNKGGVMRPIYKSGDQAVAKNYRGIMPLNTLSKCFHAILRKKVMEHLTPIRMESQLGGFAYH